MQRTNRFETTICGRASTRHWDDLSADDRNGEIAVGSLPVGRRIRLIGGLGDGLEWSIVKVVAFITECATIGLILDHREAAGLVSSFEPR